MKRLKEKLSALNASLKRAGAPLVATLNVIALCGLCSLAVAADGDVTLNPANGHFYQRIETGYTWDQAKTNCENKGGHLATITSADEQAFVTQSLGLTSNYYWIGLTSAAKAGTWVWVTGEPYDWTSWADDPAADDGKYAYLDRYDAYSWDNYYGESSKIGSVCEWSNANYKHTAVLSDIDGSGAPELASLGVDPVKNKYSVSIRDFSTKKVLKTLTFGAKASVPVNGMVVINDLNGNGIPEIGVLYLDTSLQLPTLEIKDALNNIKIVKTYRFLTVEFIPTAVTVSPDENGNGFDEITVIGVSRTNGKFKAEKRDSKTGKVLASMWL